MNFDFSNDYGISVTFEETPYGSWKYRLSPGGVFSRLFESLTKAQEEAHSELVNEVQRRQRIERKLQVITFYPDGTMVEGVQENKILEKIL